MILYILNNIIIKKKKIKLNTLNNINGLRSYINI